MRHDHTGSGSVAVAQAFLRLVAASEGGSGIPSEVDMRYNTISGHSPIGEAVWIVAGIIIMFAFGDAFVLSALAFGIVTMTGAWFTHRQAERRAERNDAEMAPVTHLRPALTGQRHLKKSSAHGSRAA